MNNSISDKATERFLEYVSFDTASDYGSVLTPSTKGQKTLARLLLKQCGKLGFDDVTFSDEGYLYCFLKGTGGIKNSVGFIAHMDTSPDFNGKNVKPRIVKYTGGELPLNDLTLLSPDRFPSLNTYVGADLIVTDGTSLLGADDKAGIAEIMTAVEYIVDNKCERPDIFVAFTPDEEIGRGMDNFDLSLFNPNYSYTVDGGGLGELEFESFNAARAEILIKGEAVHPGYAKGIMKNALLIAQELIGMLPKNQVPAETEGYEGYFHVNKIRADVSEAEIALIIRDFDKCNFTARKTLLENCVNKINLSYGNRARLEIRDEYFNMGEIISKNMTVVDIAKTAYEAAGIVPVIKPIRGGTDGSRLSFMGIPCPNIFAGGHNFHGPYEYIPISSMQKAVEVIVNIIKKI